MTMNDLPCRELRDPRGRAASGAEADAMNGCGNRDGDPGDQHARGRLRALAASMDCLTEEDLALLAGVKLSTVLAWRKRGQGPAYVLFGRQVLYPRADVAAHLNSRVRAPRAVRPVEVL
jgi:hypothetical protein